MQTVKPAVLIRPVWTDAPSAVAGSPGLPLSPLSPFAPAAPFVPLAPAGPVAPVSPLGPVGAWPGAKAVAFSVPALIFVPSTAPALILAAVTAFFFSCLEPTLLAGSLTAAYDVPPSAAN